MTLPNPVDLSYGYNLHGSGWTGTLKSDAHDLKGHIYNPLSKDCNILFKRVAKNCHVKAPPQEGAIHPAAINGNLNVTINVLNQKYFC